MSGAVFSDVDSFGSLKELYQDDQHMQDNIMSSLYGFIRKASEGEVEFDGKNFNAALRLQQNESYAAINDSEQLPTSGIIKSVFAQYRAKLMYAVLEGTQFALTRGHANGRVDGKYVDDFLKSTLLTFTSNIDADLYGDGNGFRATIATATGAAASFTVSSSALLRAGMQLDWYDSTLATKRGSIQIATKGIDRVGKTVYVDSDFVSGAVPSGATAGDVLVVYGSLAPGNPTDGRHLAGLSRLTDSSVSLGGVSSSTYAYWMPTNQNAASGNISQELLQLQFDTMYLVSQLYPNKMVFNTAQKRAYLSNFLNQRRFTSNNFDTGASSLTFSPIKMGEDEKNKKPGSFQMLEDKNCPPDRFYFWNDKVLCLATDYQDAPHLADEDGSELRYRIGYDSLQGFYRFWCNTVVFQRNAIGKIYGLATPSGVI